MRKLKIAACALCLALLIPLLLRAAKTLPLDTRPLVAEKYGGWSGVLRVWVYEGWPSGTGSLSPWLNRCATRFEKSHPGVYVQPRFVDADAISTLNDSGILPPDMILFPPGLLASPTGLTALEQPDALRPALADCGAWNGETFAVPIAMGGYLWAWNAQRIDGIPDIWRDTDGELAVPPPERWRRWDAALLALCSGRYHESDEGDLAAPHNETPFGLELGLPQTETPAPTATPVPDDGATLSCRLPDGFDFDENAWRRFINGEVAAMPVTQREIRRLQALADQGKGPDWHLSRGASSFTDQLLCLAIVDQPDAAPRQALCVQFLDCLLSDECQAELHRAAAFSVTDAASGYGSGDPLATLDALLREPSLCVPRCFDSRWIVTAEEIVRKFIEDSEDASTLWGCLRDSLRKNPNNQ